MRTPCRRSPCSWRSAAARTPSRCLATASAPTQLKANAVTAAKVKNRSLLASDFKRGQLILGTAARADDQDPPAAPSGTDVAKMTLTTRSAGKIFVIGSLRDPFLTCARRRCSAQWGAYVDNKPVPNTGADAGRPPRRERRLLVQHAVRRHDRERRRRDPRDPDRPHGLARDRERGPARRAVERDSDHGLEPAAA